MARPSKETIRLRKMARHMRLAVARLESDDRPVRVVNHNTGRDLDVNAKEINKMSKVEFKWGVFNAVICENELGEKYMKADYIAFDKPTLLSDLSTYLNEQHHRLISSINPKHFKDVGWIASPVGKEWTEEQAFEIFERMAV